jgi:hypothetical protein
MSKTAAKNSTMATTLGFNSLSETLSHKSVVEKQRWEHWLDMCALLLYKAANFTCQLVWTADCFLPLKNYNKTNHHVCL